jgi:hypothetical protein
VASVRSTLLVVTQPLSLNSYSSSPHIISGWACWVRCPPLCSQHILKFSHGTSCTVLGLQGIWCLLFRWLNTWSASREPSYSLCTNQGTVISKPLYTGSTFVLINEKEFMWYKSNSGYSWDRYRTVVQNLMAQKQQMLSVKQTKSKRTGGMIQVVEHNPSMFKGLSSNPQNTRRKKKFLILLYF